jgi:hypothetical protein
MLRTLLFLYFFTEIAVKNCPGAFLHMKNNQPFQAYVGDLTSSNLLELNLQFWVITIIRILSLRFLNFTFFITDIISSESNRIAYEHKELSLGE